MAKKQDDFVVEIKLEDGEVLKGKFTTQFKLSMAEILNMDAMRRQLLGPNPEGVGAEAAAVSYAIAKIRTYCTATPSFWKDHDEGLGFEDINVPLIILGKLEECLKKNNATVAKAADEAAKDLKKEVAQ